MDLKNIINYYPHRQKHHIIIIRRDICSEIKMENLKNNEEATRSCLICGQILEREDQRYCDKCSSDLKQLKPEYPSKFVKTPSSVKDYNWAFPLIGGIIALIALLTPAGYYSDYSGSMNFWMWGLLSIYAYGYGGITTFTHDPGEIIISATSTIIVLISIIMIITKANRTRNYGDESKWLGASISLIIGTIIWIAGIEINGQIYSGISIWSIINPGFGVIGMFLGAILAIIGHAVSKMSHKQPRDLIVPKKIPFVSSPVSKPIETSVESRSTTFKYCPNCGDKFTIPDQKYCGNCGFEINNIQ